MVFHSLNKDSVRQIVDLMLVTVTQQLKEKGIKLGKPKGVMQASMYDKDKEKIFQLYDLGVPIKTIIKTHLK